MKDDFDSKFFLSRLTSSRICHDLVNSVSSLIFAIDSISDWATNKDEANYNPIKLAERTIEILQSRVNYFRYTFGAVDMGSGVAAYNKTKHLIFALFKEKDLVNFLWTVEHDQNLIDVANSENMKLILNVFFVVFSLIPKVADITVDTFFVDEDKDRLVVSILVKGEQVKISLDKIQALKLEVKEEDLTPINIQAYLTGMLAKSLGSVLEFRDNLKGEIQVALTVDKV